MATTELMPQHTDGAEVIGWHVTYVFEDGSTEEHFFDTDAHQDHLTAIPVKGINHTRVSACTGC